MKKLLLTLFASLVLCGCSTNNPVGAALKVQPDVATSEFLRTSGGGFYVSFSDKTGTRTCQYTLTLKPVKPLTSPLFLRAEFENPSGGRPFTTDGELQPGAPHVILLSSPVSGLRSSKVYRVDVGVYSDSSRAIKLNTHTQYIKSYINL
jgi:hypothetical protein